MALAQQSGVVMTVVELRRTGTGDLVESDVSFRWDGPTHSSAQGTISPKLVAKIVRKEIPGSNEVVHQGMSATWQPFELKGEWRDIWMGQGQAWATYLEFARMCQRMPLVRVTLDALSFTGMLEDFTPEYHHQGWIGWSFTLSPEENENVKSDVLLGAGETNVQKSIPQWIKDSTDGQDAVDGAISAAMNIPVSTEDVNDASDASGELDDAVTRLSTLGESSGIEGLSADLVSGVQNVGSDVTELVWALPASFERVRRAAINVAVAVKDQRADLAIASDDFLQALRFSQYVHDTTASCWSLAGSSRDAAIDMRSRASQRPRAIYVARPGDVLERISIKFYGTPENADLIYRANSLASIVLQGGEELIIPDVGA